jgi:uncharacterized protein YecE (DUF72 family)
MQFGHAYDSIDKIDFSLPPDSAETLQTLKAANYEGELQVFVGASKWGEKTWLGQIYPNKTPDHAFLPFYCRSFNCVEFSTMFYNIYPPEAVAKWVRQVEDVPGFRLCPKFPQAVSHIRRLSNAEEHTARFYQSLTAIGKQLGPLMLQLPDNFTPKSFLQLKTYLEALPTSAKVHIEVRHKDWYGIPEHRKALFTLLRQLNIGTVISDVSARRDCAHMELTTNEAIIRFVGNKLMPSDYTRMDEWIERLKTWKGMGLKTVYFFMHQNDERFVPEACDYLIRKMNAVLGTTVAGPKFVNKN